MRYEDIMIWNDITLLFMIIIPIISLFFTVMSKDVFFILIMVSSFLLGMIIDMEISRRLYRR